MLAEDLLKGPAHAFAMGDHEAFVAALVHVFRQPPQHGASCQVQLVQVPGLQVIQSRLTTFMRAEDGSITPSYD